MIRERGLIGIAAKWKEQIGFTILHACILVAVNLMRTNVVKRVRMFAHWSDLIILSKKCLLNSKSTAKLKQIDYVSSGLLERKRVIHFIWC